MKGKLSKILVAITLVIIMAASVTGMVFSIISFSGVQQLKEEKKERDDKEADTENVLIAGTYQIQSTEAISDAYISGDTSKLNEEDKKTLELAKAVIDEIITEDMSDYEKEEAIYTWICENITGDTGVTVAVPEAMGIYDRPFGVLQNKQAVCVGYATTFRLLTNMVGLDCMVMHDTSLGHSWNIVQLDDGCWYIVDCYYDAGTVSHMNFNMNVATAQRSHDWDPALYPVANGTEYNYIEMNKVELADSMELIEKIAELYNAEENYGVFSLSVMDDEKAMAELYYIAEGIGGRLSSDYSYACVELVPSADKKSVLAIYSYEDYSDDWSDDFIDFEIDYESLDEALNENFGEYNYWEDNWGNEWEDDWDEEYIGEDYMGEDCMGEDCFEDIDSVINNEFGVEMNEDETTGSN